LQGVWKGAVGGAVIYSGKELIKVSSVKNTYAYVWPARLLNSIGSSMIYNGLNNDKIFSNLYFQFYCTYIRYNFKNNDLTLKIDPITIGYAAYLMIDRNYIFNLKNTLQLGSFMFENITDTSVVDGKKVLHVGTTGLTLGNSFFAKKYRLMIYNMYKQPDGTYAFTGEKYIKNMSLETNLHEIVHTLQYEQCIPMNYFLNKGIFLWNPAFYTLYFSGNIRGYDNNPFEKTANFYSKSYYDNLRYISR